MLQVFQSNRLEVLVTLLSEQIKQPANADDIFAAETVMVHSPGMSQWLKLQLAERNGIAANIDFPLPSSFIWRLYQKLLQNVPAESPFNKDKMSWRIYQLLPKRLTQTEFVAVSQYLAAKKPISHQQLEQQLSFEQLRRFQLAEKIADVFDNYLMYRQHWLEHWQLGHNDLPLDGSSDDIKQQDWQAILWRDLVSDIEQSYENNVEEAPLSRAHMHQLLLDKLIEYKNDSGALNEIITALPKRLFVFGISTLPKSQLEVLQALGEHIDVQVMWLNPCALFWGDILSDKTLARINAKDAKQALIAQTNIEQKEQYFIVGNPLLASWGKVGRDYLDNLAKADIDMMDIFIEQEPDTLLAKLQQDILNLEFRGEQTPLTPEQIHSDFGKRNIAVTDDSVLVHSCHSRIRELEVLRDKLLGWFEQNPELQPKDVLVMVPDVEQYAPFIDAIFAKREDKKHEFIPYTIADRGGLLENPLLNTFNQLLLLPSSRFNVSELLDHLEVPAMLTRFGLSDAELVLLKSWINDCQIKWAKSAEHKGDWGLPQIELNTWVYGLKRMLLGVALPEQGIWQDILAYQHIEGLNAQTLGKLLNYFSFLLELEQELQQQKTLSQWHSLIGHLVDYLFDQQEHELNTQLTVQKIREANQRLLSYENLSQSGESAANEVNQGQAKIGYRLLQHYFVTGLNESGVVQRFLAGSMNFCTLMPMRSVPFKVVCVLGLNEGDYPRQVDPISFDLVGLNSPRKGDRSRKHDDRYLFLEALVSAREKLHLSFVGQSSKNNNAMVPSVILSELLDYIDSSFIAEHRQDSVADSIKINHKLQPFNQSYFQQEQQQEHQQEQVVEGGTVHYQSFDQDWFELANAKYSEQILSKNNETVSAGISSEGTKLESPKLEGLQLKNAQLNQELDLADFIDFFSHPIRYFYRRVLDIRLELTEQELSDHEVFSHDGLDRFSTLTQLIEKSLLNKEVSAQMYLRSGHFPTQKWGEKLYEQYLQQASELASFVRELFGDDVTLEALPLEYSHEGQLLHGQVTVTEQTSASGATLYHSFELRAGDIRPQDKLSAWLQHLVKSVCFKSGVTLLIDKKGKLQWFEPMAPDHAQTLLTPWLQLFNQQQGQLLKWHVALALAYVEGQNKGLSLQALDKEIMKQLTPNGFIRNLADDAYVSKVITGTNDLPEDFAELSQALLVPMLEELVVQSKSKAKPSALEQGEG